MAFFLEAGFLGVLLFGRKLVPRWAHFVAALMVAVGTLLSDVLDPRVNSWMQTPTGLSMRATAASIPDDWIADHLQSVVPVSLRAHGRRRSM